MGGKLIAELWDFEESYKMENRGKGNRPNTVDRKQASDERLEENFNAALQQRPIKVNDRHTISNLLQELNFPASRLEVIRRFGKVELLWSEEEPIMIDDIMSDIHQDQFDSLVDLTDAICATLRMAFGDYSVENQAGILEAD